MFTSKDRRNEMTKAQMGLFPIKAGNTIDYDTTLLFNNFYNYFSKRAKEYRYDYQKFLFGDGHPDDFPMFDLNEAITEGINTGELLGFILQNPEETGLICPSVVVCTEYDRGLRIKCTKGYFNENQVIYACDANIIEKAIKIRLILKSFLEYTESVSNYGSMAAYNFGLIQDILLLFECVKNMATEDLDLFGHNFEENTDHLKGYQLDYLMRLYAILLY